VPTVLIYP